MPVLCALPLQITLHRPRSLVRCSGVDISLICSGSEWSRSLSKMFVFISLFQWSLWGVDDSIVTSAFSFSSFESKHVSPLCLCMITEQWWPCFSLAWTFLCVYVRFILGTHEIPPVVMVSLFFYRCDYNIWFFFWRKIEAIWLLRYVILG